MKRRFSTVLFIVQSFLFLFLSVAPTWAQEQTAPVEMRRRMRYEAEYSEFEYLGTPDEVLFASGAVRVELPYNEQTVLFNADQMLIRTASGIVYATGSVHIDNGTYTIRCERMVYNETVGAATFEGQKGDRSGVRVLVNRGGETPDTGAFEWAVLQMSQGSVTRTRMGPGGWIVHLTPEEQQTFIKGGKSEPESTGTSDSSQDSPQTGQVQDELRRSLAPPAE